MAQGDHPRGRHHVRAGESEGRSVRPTRVEWALLALALVLRLGLVTQATWLPVSDTRDYHDLARNLAAGRGYVQVYEGERPEYRGLAFHALPDARVSGLPRGHLLHLRLGSAGGLRRQRRLRAGDPAARAGAGPPAARPGGERRRAGAGRDPRRLDAEPDDRVAVHAPLHRARAAGGRRPGDRLAGRRREVRAPAGRRRVRSAHRRGRAAGGVLSRRGAPSPAAAGPR